MTNEELQPLGMTTPSWWNLWQRWLQRQDYTSAYVLRRIGVTPGTRVTPLHVASLLMDECQKAYEQGWNDRDKQARSGESWEISSTLACGYDDGSRACLLSENHEGDHALAGRT